MTITWVEIVGYSAAIFVAASFYMKTMIPLRILAIFSNVTFMIYGAFGGLWPVLILHMFLFPLNIIRLIQMYKLSKRVREAKTGNFPVESLIPYMNKQKYKKGDVVFRKGDKADKIYYIEAGGIYLEEIDRDVPAGEVLGEVGIFSPYNQRTATGVCSSDSILHTISDEKIIQLYYQNPSFGFHVVQLIIRRFIINYIDPGCELCEIEEEKNERAR
jgi:hypothetical protein